VRAAACNPTSERRARSEAPYHPTRFMAVLPGELPWETHVGCYFSNRLTALSGPSWQIWVSPVELSAAQPTCANQL